MSSVEFKWNLGVWSVPGGRRLTAALTRALSRAGGDAARAMRTDSTRRVRERKRFKVRTVKDGLPLSFPADRNDITGLVWRMDVSGKAVPVSQLNPRQTRQGVTFSINTGRKSTIKGAFVAQMRSGHVGVFYRLGRSRLPIDEAFTSRLSDVFTDRGFIPAVYARTQSVFKASFDRLMQMELEKLKPE